MNWLSASEESSVFRKSLPVARGVLRPALTILLLFFDLMRRERVEVLNPQGQAESVLIKTNSLSLARA